MSSENPVRAHLLAIRDKCSADEWQAICSVFAEQDDLIRQLRNLLTSPGLGEDEDGMPVGYADWYNSRYAGTVVDTQRDHACEAAWRAAISLRNNS